MLHLPGTELVYCLEGTTNVSLAELTHLKHLDLSFNNFNFQAMPKFIGSLSNLEYLNLSHSWFMGIIPHEFGNLSRLSSLDLSYQGTTMRVESLSWVSHLRMLRELDLSETDLSEATNWMSIINNLPLLQILKMDGCHLASKRPSSLSYINTSNNLHVISLSGNSFNDSSIFQWLSNISKIVTSLSYLDLSFNSCSGRSTHFHIYILI